jgi:hypothetical protein
MHEQAAAAVPFLIRLLHELPSNDEVRYSAAMSAVRLADGEIGDVAVVTALQNYHPDIEGTGEGSGTGRQEQQAALTKLAANGGWRVRLALKSLSYIAVVVLVGVFGVIVVGAFGWLVLRRWKALRSAEAGMSADADGANHVATSNESASRRSWLANYLVYSIAIAMILAVLGWQNRVRQGLVMIDGFLSGETLGWPWVWIDDPFRGDQIHWLGLLFDAVTAAGFLAMTFILIHRTQRSCKHRGQISLATLMALVTLTALACLIVQCGSFAPP